MRNSRYDILFEPLQIGPVTTKNRFYQVPHCTGMGWKRPQSLAAMRGVKAEGGWGVVCTEYCSVHPTSDDGAYPFAALWNADDVRAHGLMTEAVHAHGALAGVELWLGGGFVANLATRLPTLAARNAPPTNTGVLHPVQSRRMDLDDIRQLRRWHVDAARRAVEADFDIVYVYATHGYLLSQFLSANTNDRTDEYGGNLENRVRLVRELIEETKDAVGDRCAVATRFSVDIDDNETFDAFSLLAELPDLWDLTVNDYGVEMGVSRFTEEGALADSVSRAKTMTSKPIVAVGRFTSPDTMARIIRTGVQDMIGAARPSIADPFLPKKIEDGREDDIRECIGCNICYAHDSLGVPIRCTQNPTMGEEWRLGWHPENVRRSNKSDKVLVVGAGPAGLEAARVLGERGYEVLLAEERRVLGGRVTEESALPGLSEWARVRDWRVGQIEKLNNVEVYRESPMTASDALAVGAKHIFLATGARWATDGIGRHRDLPITIAAGAQVISANDILCGADIPQGRALIFDDDHYYMGAVLALELRRRGSEVVLMTPAGRAGEWSGYTEEMYASNAKLIGAGVEIVTNHLLTHVEPGVAHASCVFTDREKELPADWVLPLTRRDPNDQLFHALRSDPEKTAKAGVKTLQRIGDCDAAGIIAAAVYSGYRAGIELGESVDESHIYARREIPLVAD